MIESISILTVLALGVVLFLLTAYGAPFIVTALPLTRLWPSFCRHLCNLRVLLALVFGLAVGFFLCMCWPAISHLLNSELWCHRYLLIVLFLSFLLAFWFAWTAVCCRSPSLPRITALPANWLLLILLFLALVVFAALLFATGQRIDALLVGAQCAKLLLGVVLIGILILLLRAFGCRYCEERPSEKDNCGTRMTFLGMLLLLLLLLAVWLISHCRDTLRPNFELAMVGIWWEGKYENDTGAHLRWAFDEPLPFPQNGFDLYRRESASGGWVKLNTPGPIHPATTWSGAGNPTRWVDRGADRVPAAVHPRYEAPNSENFDHLQEMLGYPDLYATLYYVEGINAPFTDPALAAAAAAAAGKPVAQWQITPMALLQTMALHPEVARLLGLYYIDRTANPNVEYDYQIVGHWSDRDRSYQVSRLSRPNTGPLARPVLQRTDALADSTKPIPGGGWWSTEARVALGWEPPTADPAASLGPADGIRPVFHRIERADVGPALGPFTPPGPYQLVTVPNDAGQFVPLSPIAAQPKELADGTEAWPYYFAYDAWVDYRTYDYRLVGIDVFGRDSIPSLPKRVSVTDTVAPPPPINVEATIYQRADPAIGRMRQAEREKLFPNGSTNQYAIRVSWLWTDALRVRYPDLKAFRIFYRFTGFDDFSKPASRPKWHNPAEYEAQLGGDKDVADREPAIPDRYRNPSSATGFVFPAAEGVGDDPAIYYEAIFTDLDPALVALITANDDPTVKYGFVTVASVDHGPFNNQGSGATPVTVYSRDFIAPNRPPAPSLRMPPGSADRAGNVHLTMRVQPAEATYRYIFSRVPQTALAGIADPGSLPSGCVAAADAAEAALQRKTAASGAPLKPVNATSIVPAALAADLVDGINATVGSTQVYVAYAIDPAGNKSEASCPSIPVQIIDRVAPRAPVVTKALGADSAVAITWSGNSESDLDRYLVYRTADEERLSSKRRMQLVLEADASGASQDASLGAEDAIAAPVGGETRLTWNDRNVTPGTTYYYRIVARDQSDNASEPSHPVSARPVDLTPPAAPLWAETGAIAWVPDTNGVDRVALAWQEVPNEHGLRYLVRRRAGDEVRWTVVSSWIEGTTSFTDIQSRPGRAYKYQVRAMDGSGNKGDWSEIRMSP